MSEPRAYTADEAREMFLDAVRNTVRFWRTAKIEEGQDRLEGLAFSILSIIDGVSMGMPCAIDLVLKPHPTDKQFHIDEGDNWVEDGMCINGGVYLHDLLREPR